MLLLAGSLRSLHSGEPVGTPTLAALLALAAEELGDVEGEVERLAGVEARVAHRLVALVELVLEHLVGAAEALGDVLARELDVHTTRRDVGGRARGEEPLELAHDVAEP